MSPEIKAISTTEFNKMGIKNWPIWEKDISEFEWIYDEKEVFYLIQGQISLVIEDKEYEIIPGDFVTCPKGLKCYWKINEYVKKHYHFIE